jgi:thiamine-monophosphate kinase
VDAWTGSPTVGEAGELTALAAILPRLPASSLRLLGPGDDAAVIAAPDGRYVVTSDSMVEGPDFLRAWSSPYDLGWKLAAVNLADVAAMGARPTALVVALAVPRDLPVAALEGIADGLREACEALAPGCGVEGGDLAESPVVTAVATAFGDLEGRDPVRRSGARIGDIVATTGALGWATQGWRWLERGARLEPFSLPEGADVGEATRVRARSQLLAQLRPSPKLGHAIAAAVAGATSMLDISDGLALDAGRIAAASGVRIDFGDGAVGVLDAAEDHAFLTTFPPGVTLPDGFSPIGSVVEGSGVSLHGEPLETLGWDPFRA